MSHIIFDRNYPTTTELISMKFSALMKIDWSFILI